jgi:peptidoglycan/LPS O-acetylase OafA/YrhL
MLLWHPLPWPMLYGWLVPPHLDAPATGLLLAWLKHQRPATWARLAGSPLSLLAGLLLFGASLTLRGVPAAMAFPLLANAASAFAILWLHGLSFGAADRRLRPSAAWGSRLTYCLYLAHWPVFGIWPTLGLAPPVAVSVCVVLGASVLFALLLHVGVEKPFLQLRRRWDAGPIAPAGLARSS